jgi:hypothetical protein
MDGLNDGDRAEGRRRLALYAQRKAFEEAAKE